jgi:hypothetical protein
MVEQGLCDPRVVFDAEFLDQLVGLVFVEKDHPVKGQAHLFRQREIDSRLPDVSRQRTLQPFPDTVEVVDLFAVYCL